MKLKKNPTGSHAQSAAFVLLKVVCLDPSDWTSSLFGTKGYIAITQILWSLFYDAHIFMDFFYTADFTLVFPGIHLPKDSCTALNWDFIQKTKKDFGQCFRLDKNTMSLKGKFLNMVIL